MKILIVDDEDIQRQKLVQLISESPLSFSDILCAPEVPTAIDIIETHHPDIVLSDIRMPVKNGLDLAQYVKETYPEILVILITGYSEFKYAQAAIRYNVFDYILKPIDAESTLSYFSFILKTWSLKSFSSIVCATVEFEVLVVFTCTNIAIVKTKQTNPNVTAAITLLFKFT